MRLGVGHDVHGSFAGSNVTWFALPHLCSSDWHLLASAMMESTLALFSNSVKPSLTVVRAPGILVEEVPEGGAWHGAQENRVFDGILAERLPSTTTCAVRCCSQELRSFSSRRSARTVKAPDTSEQWTATFMRRLTARSHDIVR